MNTNKTAKDKVVRICNNLIEFFALCGAVGFWCGFSDYNAFIVSSIFFILALLCALVRNAYID